jgi:hypothetical protein
MCPNQTNRLRIFLISLTLVAGACYFADQALAVDTKPAPPPEEVVPSDRPPEDLPPEDLPSDEFGPQPGDGFGPGNPDRFGPRGPRDRRMGALLWSRLSDEEREQVRAFMAEHFPERYEEILELQQNEERLEMHMGRIMPEMMRLRELSERDPQVFDMRVQELRGEFRLRQIARQLRFREGGVNRKELEDEARALIEQQFDLRQHRMETEIVRLEQKIEQLRSGLEDRAAKRDMEIDLALERIISGEEAPDAPKPRHPQRFRGRDRADDQPE